MSPSRPFILRPIATSLLMAGLLLAGAIGFRQLPVSALPQVDYPTIQVVTFYPGASPDVMASAVTAPLERQFGQLPGLNQMTSTSSDGSSLITLQFDLELDIDVAEQQVQAAINASGTYLPADLPNPPIYSKTNPADAPILTLALTSKTLPLSKVEDLADTRLAQKISQLAGVGLVSISGGQKPAVRIQANPTALSSHGLTLEDVRTAVSQSNVNQAKGELRREPSQAYQIGANDQLLSSDQLSTPRRRLPERRAGAALGRGHGDRRRRERPAGGVDERRAGGHPEHPAPAGRQHHQRRGPRSRPCCRSSARRCPRRCEVSILTDRTTTIRASVQDVRVRADAHHRPGRDGDLPVPAHPLRHRHPQRGRAPVARGHVRRDVPARLQPEQPDAHGPHHLHGLRRGRRDRDDREHHALHRGGDAAARGRAQGLGADRLHDRLADGLADRRADPAALHGRHRRPPVPRVRRDAVGDDPGLGGRLADPDADDVREAAARTEAGVEQGRFYRGVGARVRADHRVLRPDAHAGCCGARRRRSLVAVATLAADRPALRHHPQGLLPDPGHRRDPRHLRSARRASRSRRWPTASRRWRESILQGSRPSRACRRSSASTARTRRSTAAASRST